MRNSVAIFWDFTQLHQNILEDICPGDSARRLVGGEQPEVVDVKTILRHIDKLGRVTLNRCYANWLPLGAYAPVFSEAPVELVQLFPNKLGNTMVDRSIVADVLDHLNSTPPVDTVVVIGGGTEYRQLRQIVKEKNCELIGLGVKAGEDDFWAESCDRFVNYSEIGPRKLFAGFPDADEAGMSKIRQQLVVAMNHLSRHYGEEWIQQVRIKPAIIRQDPDFNEGLYGYDSFSRFLREQDDILQRRHREGQQEPEYRLGAAHLDGDLDPSPPKNDRDYLVNHYLRVAGQQGIRMPDPVIMWEGIDVYATFLADEVAFSSFSEIDVECLRLLKLDFPDLTMTEVKKVRQVLFKCFLFRPSLDETIGFHEDIHGLEDIEDRYFELMLARVGDNINEPLNYEALSVALTGSDDQAERLERLNSSRQ